MNGIVRYARPGAERVLGWDDAQLVGSSLAAIPGGEAIPLHIGQADALELDNPGDPAEVDLQAADGHAIALEFVVTRTLYDGESLLVVNVRTLTSQRSSRLAAPWSHAHSQALLDAMPDQILRFDRDGRYLGSAGATSAGSPFTDETLGKTFREVLPATLAALCEDAITIAMTGGGVQTLRYSNARANGVRQFETRISVVASREVLAIVRDVTDQTEATAGLERLVQILDATPDFICSFVPDGEVEYTNAAFRRLFAIGSDKRLRTADVLERFPEIRRLLNSVVIPAAIENGHWRGDLDFVSGDTNAPVSTTVLAHRRPGEPPHHLTIMGRDIRRRRESDAKMVAAKEAAEAASRAKSDFLATMSHEIRTPMNGIIGAVELLIGTELSSEQGELAHTLRDSSEALLSLINDILDLSKIEANAVQLEHVRFGLRATIDSACVVLRSVAAKKGLRLFASVDELAPDNLAGDPSRVTQILINLVGNAIKFTQVGEVVVRVGVAEDLGDNDVRVRFEVVDTGMGISSDVKSRLFQTFAQGDSSMSRRFGGTGLGLAISARLAKLMGGDIGVESCPGEGSTFWFTATFEKVAEAEQAEAQADLATVREVRAPRPDARILLVEDYQVNRMIVSAMLRRLGYNPDVAVDGAEALEAASATAYDLIFMDCQMPEMDGFEATARIRGLGGDRHIPIVALTANATSADRDRCLAAGMDDYLAKPVRSSSILEKLSKWLPDADSVAAELGESSIGPAAEATPETVAETVAEPAAPPPDTQLIDPVTIADLRSLNSEGTDDILTELVDLFLDQTRDQVAKLEMAVQSGDGSSLRQLAHGLKGEARNVGAHLVGELAAELERRAMAGSQSEPDLVNEIRTTIVDTKAAFLAERTEYAERTLHPRDDRGEAA
jgi:signal transduction histidine kinase/DNA-binding NarL/FixJ family response regulator/HPt (histidine-containing phosphotransfer) domain-containing protein